MRLPAASEEDFESLPPAVRRKFFSNVERMRIRLAQSDPSFPAGSTPNYHANYAQSAYQTRPTRPNARLGPGPLHFSHSRALRNASTTSLTRGRGLHKHPAQPASSTSLSTPKKLRKPGSLQLAYLVAQADSQCFHSLPAKVQQKLFSPEERRRFHGALRQSVIYDAADEAFYRRPNYFSQHQQSTDSLPSDVTLPVAQPDTVFWDSEDSDLDEEADEASSRRMDPSFYDSFRWLDEDGDLDLSLDEYHAHVADAAAAKSKSRRRPSFRRSLSFSTHSLKQHRPSPSMPTRALPASQSFPLQHQQQLGQKHPLSPLVNPQSSSRPSSRQQQPFHAPKSSTSSIDPAAQYYHDPDARLKLRVYLASPQKFDEAIEFGFPALDQNKENITPEKPLGSPNPVSVASEWTGTFFEDDDGTMVGSPGGSIEDPPAPSPPLRMASQLQEVPRPSVDNPPSLLQRRQSFLPLSSSRSGPQSLLGNREMTLKMTLTRPDLRTESPTPSPQEDPLRLAALPPADRAQMIWESDWDEQGMVKKMWRKLRRRT
ncbi:hypothetical protein N7462_004193 [Penicillium macrosclerotiorum]|uniref:uncharacterized protein n=1 Tax=Penicillium macrosclerotiorum TaxID=303699 RepID=UPI0025474558|nr:uncharacterized protein N7462_004193 [Penicillium macrosclerotiorum]KAJ5689801.1 hypothetical protein N7462_004193 [Penicillium macrosclerotiorum]